MQTNQLKENNMQNNIQMNTQLDFKFIKDIIYYDGPLLSLGITQENNPVLVVWNDIDHEENYNLYSYIFIRQEDLYPFIHAEKSFYNVLKDSDSIVSWKYNGEAYDFEVTDIEYYLSNYGPKTTANLEKDFIDFLPDFNAFLEQNKSLNIINNTTNITHKHGV